jgi:hypothetical protein
MNTEVENGTNQLSNVLGHDFQKVHEDGLLSSQMGDSTTTGLLFDQLAMRGDTSQKEARKNPAPASSEKPSQKKQVWTSPATGEEAENNHLPAEPQNVGLFLSFLPFFHLSSDSDSTGQTKEKFCCFRPSQKESQGRKTHQKRYAQLISNNNKKRGRQRRRRRESKPN